MTPAQHPVPARWAHVARLLSRTVAGRRGGMTPQLAADAAALSAVRASNPAPVRVGVLRRLPDTGVIGLLTGDPDGGRTPGPGLPEVLPLCHVPDEDPLRLSIGPQQAAVLEGWAGRAAARELPPATRAWLWACRRTGRPCFPSEPEDVAGAAGTAAAWQRIQDIALHTAGGSARGRDMEALEPLFAEPIVRRGRTSGRLLLGGGPVPVELLDIPAGPPGRGVDATGAVSRLAGACHAVLMLIPAADLSTGPAPEPGHGPTPSDRNGNLTWLRSWTDALTAYPHGPKRAYLALSARPRGAVPLPELAGWLGGRLPVVLGTPRIRCRVYALAVTEAQRVTRVLAAPGHSTAALVEQAHADRIACGLAELTEGLATLVRECAEALPDLTRRRLATAFDDTRMICRETAFAREWTLGPLDGTTPLPPSDGAAERGSDADGAELWDRFETYAAGLLAVRVARRAGRPAPSTGRGSPFAPRYPDDRQESRQEGLS